MYFGGYDLICHCINLRENLWDQIKCEICTFEPLNEVLLLLIFHSQNRISVFHCCIVHYGIYILFTHQQMHFL